MSLEQLYRGSINLACFAAQTTGALLGYNITVIEQAGMNEGVELVKSMMAITVGVISLFIQYMINEEKIDKFLTKAFKREIILYKQIKNHMAQPKASISSIIGLFIVILTSLGAIPQFAAYSYVIAAVIFGANTFLSVFFPSETGTGYIKRSTFNFINILLFMLAVVGYFIDTPQIINGVAHYVIPVDILTALSAIGTAVLRYLSGKNG